MNNPIHFLIQSTRNNKKSGFGLIEVLVSIGIVSIIALGITSMMTTTMKQQKGIQAKDQQREVTAEIRTLLNNKTACLNSFGGGNPQTGITATSLRDGTVSPGNIKYTINTNDKTGMLIFKEFGVSNWVVDLSTPTQGNADLKIKLSKVGDTGSVREIKPDVITLRIKRDGSGNIIECFSVGSQSDSLWQVSPANSSDIYYSAGKVGVGDSAPASPLTVNGRIDSNSSGGAGGYISTGNYGGTGTAAYFPTGLWAQGPNNWIYGNINTNGTMASTTSTYSLSSATGVFTGGGLGITGSSTFNGSSDFTGSFVARGSQFLYQGGGDFGFVDSGVPDSTAVRFFSSGSALYLQTGNSGLIRFRDRQAGIMMDLNGGSLTVANTITASGIRTRAGTTAAAGANNFNINWTGAAAELWIDTTNVGSISLSSDRRLKHHIEDYNESGLEQIMNLRPVTYRWQNKSIFKDDGTVHRGFIADEIQAVIPTAATYSKNAVDDKGKDKYQSIIILELLPVIVKAIQEIENKINKFIISFLDMSEHTKKLEQKILLQDTAIQKLSEQNLKIKTVICEIKPTASICKD